jgi:hypothetical protein
MPLFLCSVCGCYENTALSNYWMRTFDKPKGQPPAPPLCSACDPKIAAWHGRFAQKPAEGMFVGADGFLYHPSEIETRSVRHTKIVARIEQGAPVVLEKAGR